MFVMVPLAHNNILIGTATQWQAGAVPALPYPPRTTPTTPYKFPSYPTPLLMVHTCLANHRGNPGHLH